MNYLDPKNLYSREQFAELSSLSAPKVLQHSEMMPEFLNNYMQSLHGAKLPSSQIRDKFITFQHQIAYFNLAVYHAQTLARVGNFLTEPSATFEDSSRRNLTVPAKSDFDSYSNIGRAAYSFLDLRYQHQTNQPIFRGLMYFDSARKVSATTENLIYDIEKNLNDGADFDSPIRQQFLIKDNNHMQSVITRQGSVMFMFAERQELHATLPKINTHMESFKIIAYPPNCDYHIVQTVTYQDPVNKTYKFLSASRNNYAAEVLPSFTAPISNQDWDFANKCLKKVLDFAKVPA